MDDLAEVALGGRMHSQSLVLRGRLPEREWKRFLTACVAAIGMTPFAEPVVWRYPQDEKYAGGLIFVQPIMESFVALDTWPNHDGAYLFIASCREFKTVQVMEVVRQFGLLLDVEASHAPITLRIA